MLMTRPDLCYSIKELSQFMHGSGTAQTKAAKRVARYLNHTQNLGLKFTAGGEVVCVGFVDSNLADLADQFLCTMGYVFYVAGCPVSFRSKKMKSVALSSTDAEIVAACEAAKEATWLRHLLSELGFEQQGPTVIHGDNSATVAISKNPCKFDAKKHILRKAAYLREMVRKGEVVLEQVASKENVADLMTKPVDITTFQKLAPMAMGYKKFGKEFPSDGEGDGPKERDASKKGHFEEKVAMETDSHKLEAADTLKLNDSLIGESLILSESHEEDISHGDSWTCDESLSKTDITAHSNFKQKYLKCMESPAALDRHTLLEKCFVSSLTQDKEGFDVAPARSCRWLHFRQGVRP